MSRSSTATGRRINENNRKNKKEADAASAVAAPKLDTLLTMPSLSSASVAAAEEASQRKQAQRGGRASTLLSDPNERPLAARDIATETAAASLESDRRRVEEYTSTPEYKNSPAYRAMEEEKKKKKLVAMGLYTAPTTVLGG